MYTGINPSALRSQKWISDALLELLEEKTYKKTSIKEITEKCGLARQTFYQLFDSKEEIIEYHLNHLFNNYLHEIQTLEITNTEELAKLYFLFFQNNKSFIYQLVKNDLIYILNRKFYSYLKEINMILEHNLSNDLLSPYAISFISSGLVGILVYWFKQDDMVTIDELALVVSEILNTKYLK